AFAEGVCKAAGSVSLVSNACVGKASCTVSANNGTFGDPCVGTPKRLYAQVTCSGAVSAGICASARENGTATLTCPVGQVIAAVSFASYGTPAGSCGSYIQGAAQPYT